MRVSNSLLNTFQECPKKFKFKYIDKLKDEHYASGLNFGKFFHTHIEAIENKAKSDDKEYKEALEKYTDSIDKIEKDWLVSAAAARAHFDFWSKDSEYSDNNFDKLLIEPRMNINLGENISMTSFLDGVFQNKKSKEIVLLERKTSGASSRDGVINGHLSSSQSRRYLRIMQSNGYDTFTVLWDMIYKPLIRQKKTETPEQFIKRSVDEYQTRPEHYFERFYKIVSRDDLEESASEDEWLISQLKESKTKNFYPRNLCNCVSTYGECEFFNICHRNKSIDDYKGGK